MSLPTFVNAEDLPPGIHQASLLEVIERFGSTTPRRKIIGQRLERVYRLAVGTGHLARCVVFGSFITSKPDPNDVDVFLLMEDSFDVSLVSGEARLIFDQPIAQTYFGASIFWVRRLAAFGGEQATIEHWQIKRDRSLRGIVEIIGE